MNEAFITGSRAYGTPHIMSDVDLVIRIDQDTVTKLCKLLGDDPATSDALPVYDPDYGELAHIRVGGLNILFATTDERFESWKSGTAQLEAAKPVTRRVAVQKFKSLFRKEESK